MFDNSDDYDFTSSDNSKLASLFGVPQSFSKVEPNPSLVYKPPKQPSNQDMQASTSPKDKHKSEVLLAKAVELWKLEDKTYKSLGLYGLVIIGSTDLNLYEIIAYQEKSTIILKAKVNENFKFFNQKEKFSSFFDDESQNWLVKFEHANHQGEFSKKLESLGATVLEDQQQTPSQSTQVADKQKPELSTKPILPHKSDHSDSSDSMKRSSILDRMAKMGQPILPSVPPRVTNLELSDTEPEESENAHRVPLRKSKRLDKTPKQETVSYSMVPSTFQTTPMMPLDNISQYLLLQNNDLKMNLSQISSKVDNVLQQVNQTDTYSSEEALKSKVKALKLKCDNLEQSLSKSELECSNLKKKYKNLLEKNGQDHSELQEKLNNLQQKILQIDADKIESEEKLKYLKESQTLTDELNNKIKEHENTIETQQSKIKELEQLSEIYQDNEGKMSSTINTLNKKIENMNLKLKDFEEFSKHIQSDKERESQNRNERLNRMGEVIKRNMNEMYQSVLDSFDEDETYDFKDIQGIIANNIKETTFKVIAGCVDALKEKKIDYMDL